MLRRRLFCFLLLLGLAGGALADSEDSFREGIRAGDLKNWPDAARRMREAITADPQESKKRIVLSGVFSAPYLPHFYLGWFLYNEDRAHCEEALEEWEISERQGVVALFKRQYADLEKAREICNARVLPDAIEAAREKVAAAEQLLSRTAEATDPAVARERRSAQEKLAAARRKLDAGRSGARLGDVREAESEATEAAEILDRVARQASRLAEDRLAVAVAEAEQAIVAAERAEGALELLLKNSPAMDLAMPSVAQSRLAAAREKLTAGKSRSSLSELAEAKADATAARAELDEARTAAERLTARAAPEPTAPEAEPKTATTEVDPALLKEIRHLTKAAERFLTVVEEGEDDGDLLSLQRTRLTTLVLEARQRDPETTATTLRGLIGRLADSLAALQLIAGAQAYFAGNPRQAVDILTASELPGGPLAAQAHLLLAASRFALYRIGVAKDLEQAAADVRRCSELAPELSPDPRAFSPRFREFYDTNRSR